jgi:cytochrome P450
MSSTPAPTAALPGYPGTPGRPAYYDPERQAWQVFRYQEVKRVLSDYSTFTSERGGRFDPRDPGTNLENMVMYDPPRHTNMRGVLNHAFTPRTVARLEPFIRRLSNQLLDPLIDRGHMDIVEDFAVPLPLMVISELLGVPSEMLPEMRQISDVFVDVTAEESIQARLQAFARFAELIAQRRAEPRDDMISALIQSEDEGYRLTDSEVNAYCVGLLVAGNETTRSLIGSTMVCFSLFPEAMAEARADPGLIPGAIEEALRFTSPTRQFPRIAKVDTAIDGQTVRAGEWVMPWIESANRDPEVFPNPDVFDIRRQPNRHIAFGHGPHFCIGAALGRLEGQIAFETLFERLDNIRLAPDVALEPIVQTLLFGYRHVPISFTSRG